MGRSMKKSSQKTCRSNACVRCVYVKNADFTLTFPKTYTWIDYIFQRIKEVSYDYMYAVYVKFIHTYIYTNTLTTIYVKRTRAYR